MSDPIVSHPVEFVWQAPKARSIGGQVLGALETFVAAIRRVRHRRRDRFALASLGDRALADIGIGPGEIDHAIRHGRNEGSPDRVRTAASACTREL